MAHCIDTLAEHNATNKSDWQITPGDVAGLFGIQRNSPGKRELRMLGLRPDSSISRPALTFATRRILSIAMILQHPPMSSSVRIGRRSSALTASCVRAVAPHRESFNGCISGRGGAPDQTNAWHDHDIAKQPCDSSGSYVPYS